MSDVGMVYRKIDQRQHVLLRPGMYVGATEEDTCVAWVMDDETGLMASRTLQYVPALYKIFDEILMNAVDHSVRLRRDRALGKDPSIVVTRSISVAVDRETGVITIQNDGDGIDAGMHAEHGVHIPELIFGQLLTSANYEDLEGGEAMLEGRTVGGQNGIGAKACNIFSKWFEVETVDRRLRRVYRQLFSENMSVVGPPAIEFCSKKPYTRIRFLPDYARFGGGGGLSEAMYALMRRRAYDATAVTEPDVAVSFNGQRIECKSFERYVDLYLGAKGQGERVYERVNDWWEVAVAVSEGAAMQQVSFVNGMATVRGGKHVDHVVAQICRRLGEMVTERRKGVAVKPQYIRDNLFVFVKATVPSPTFDSQTKETLTTPVGKFGVKVELSDRFIERLYKSEIVARAVGLSAVSASKTLSKTDGRLTSTVTGIPKLDDATWAGTKRGVDCTLVLTEGDSAKSMAIAGLSEVGRDRYGVFPLRGKLMNVCDATSQKVADNAEISSIKKILGLESGKVYTSRGELRYGRVMIMTDQDLDGSHIKGLLMNMFHQLWPSLLKLEGFLASMLTPIVKAQRRRTGAKSDDTRSFYNMADLHQWQLPGSEGAGDGWRIKYYKGLGTSTALEAREYFKRMRIAVYTWDDDGRSADALDLAFNKRRADDRKAWLQGYDRDATLDYGEENVGYEVFVDRDLIHFSNYDVQRSIPSVVDGLKISQRKVMFACFKRRLVRDEIRVAQLAGYVSEHAAYHHGEMSLVGTIVNLAQNYVGSNNINLLLPNGQFGTRLHGGKDAASARYIHTSLSPLACKIFLKADEAILVPTLDDGQAVEPHTYVPIIPLVLINGAIGIGTGFSTNIPSYNPLDVMASIRMLLASPADPAEADIAEELLPWYSGFKGTVERSSTGKLVSRGLVTRTAPTKVRVTELPLGMWTQDFKEMLDTLASTKGDLRRVEGAYTDTEVDFTLTYSSAEVLDALFATVAGSDPCVSRLETALRLVSNKGLSLTNRYLFGPSGAIRLYQSTREIMVDFFKVRLEAYEQRRAAELKSLRCEAELARARVRFIELVASGELRMDGRPKSEVEEELSEVHGLAKVNGAHDHLLRMAMGSLTSERKSQLEGQMRDIDTRLASLEAMTARDVWGGDLDAFEASYRSQHDMRPVSETTAATGTAADTSTETDTSTDTDEDTDTDTDTRTT